MKKFQSFVFALVWVFLTFRLIAIYINFIEWVNSQSFSAIRIADSMILLALIIVSAGVTILFLVRTYKIKIKGKNSNIFYPDLVDHSNFESKIGMK